MSDEFRIAHERQKFIDDMFEQRLAGQVLADARILGEVGAVLGSRQAYAAMSTGQNPYGDGRASDRIANVVLSGAMELRTIEAVA